MTSWDRRFLLYHQTQQTSHSENLFCISGRCSNLLSRLRIRDRIFRNLNLNINYIIDLTLWDKFLYFISIWYSGYWLGIKLRKWTCFCLFCICWSQNNPLVSSSVVTKAAWYCSWVHQVKALSIYDSEQKICFYLFTQKVVSNELGSIW